MSSLNDAFPGYKNLINEEQLMNDYNETKDDLELIQEVNPYFDGKYKFKSRKTQSVYLYNLFDKKYLKIC